jgi:hypothetical protein
MVFSQDQQMSSLVSILSQKVRASQDPLSGH